MAYLPRIRKLVLFGGRSDDSGVTPSQMRQMPADTWLFDGASWSKVSTPHSPPSDYGFGGGIALETLRGRLVMQGETFGGDVSIKGGTYLFDGIDWAVQDGLCPPSQESGCVRGAGMATDPMTGRIVLEGGGAQAPSRATAVFNGTKWTPGLS